MWNDSLISEYTTFTGLTQLYKGVSPTVPAVIAGWVLYVPTEMASRPVPMSASVFPRMNLALWVVVNKRRLGRL